MKLNENENENTHTHSKCSYFLSTQITMHCIRTQCEKQCYRQESIESIVKLMMIKGFQNGLLLLATQHENKN